MAAARRGTSLRAVARRFRVSLLTVQRWVERAACKRLDRVCFSDRPSGPPRAANRVSNELEEMVLSLRKELHEQSALGEWGAEAIKRELEGRGIENIPTVRTIGRVLVRRGVLDARHRVRRAAPPPGWYLPEVAAGRAELDQFDYVSGLAIAAVGEVEVLNAVSLHGGLVASWPEMAFTAALTREKLIQHWRADGLPIYAQFDNDTRCQGPHQHPDTIGTVVRLCLSLGVVPVFAPPREHGLQNAIESFNGRWQAKVWARFHHVSLAALQAQSARYIAACRVRSAARIDGAPARRAFPTAWKFDARAKVTGSIIFVRRPNEYGAASVLGNRFEIDRLWPHRLVRCEVDIEAAAIRFYALRRREPGRQPLLREVAYVLPARYIKE